MKWPLISRRRHERVLAHERRGFDVLLKQVAQENTGALAMVATELSTAKEVIASHIVAAGHPSTVLHDVHSFGNALQQALTDAGVDLRLELARLEGAEL
jgi:hypothetical protein